MIQGCLDFIYKVPVPGINASVQPNLVYCEPSTGWFASVRGGPTP